jgi:hypothetical protein
MKDIVEALSDLIGERLKTAALPDPREEMIDALLHGVAMREEEPVDLRP